MMARTMGAPVAPDWRLDWAAKILVAVCVLNLNGIFFMMFDIEQVISLVMLVTSIILIAGTGGRASSFPFNLFISAIISYIIFGFIFYNTYSSVESASKYILKYFNVIVIVWALAGYVASLAPGSHLVCFLRFLRNTFFISAISILASPILYKYYVNLPLSAHQRMGGFFANPNEASTAAVMAVALILALPFRNRLVQAATLAAAALAIIMTLSKTGMTSLIIILAIHLARSAKGPLLVALLISAPVLILILQDPNSILEAIAESSLFDFSNYQKRRILEVGQVLGGQIDERTTTGRTFLWGLAIERAWAVFPFGNGLGSAHHMIGGILEFDVWQGAHNTFLMIWAEGGLLPVSLLVAAIASAAIASFRYAFGRIELSCLLVQVIAMMAGHSVLDKRYQDVMFAVIFGLVAIALRERKRNQLQRHQLRAGRLQEQQGWQFRKPHSLGQFEL